MKADEKEFLEKYEKVRKLNGAAFTSSRGPTDTKSDQEKSKKEGETIISAYERRVKN